MTSTDLYRQKLVRQLQNACAGELAAGHAYRGHWRSVRDEGQRERIKTIEAEEWHHRELVKKLLVELGAEPDGLREAIFWLIGKSIGLFCRIGGWFAPMYGAGRLERTNIVEYEDAADYALLCGHEEMVDCLLTMAEVEWEHEQFFRKVLTGHRMLKILPLWQEPAPKASIRSKRGAPLRDDAAVA